jgi:mycothiol system anti-sigma-R factor
MAQMWEYLDSELGEFDAERISRHLRDCSHCMSEYDIDMVMKKVLRRGCAEHAPDELRVRIRQLTIQPEG